MHNSDGKIKLWETSVPHLAEGDLKNQPLLTPYLVNEDAGNSSSAVIVFPGGGYARRADHEGEPVAKWLNSLGVSAFVLDYRVAPYRHPVPLLDAKRAMRYVRFHADSLGISSNRIGVLGFSAGGHLAATLATQFDIGDSSAQDEIERISSRPDFAVLCYPVIALQGPFAHRGSAENLLGADIDETLASNLSAQRMVTKDTCPTFLWHTADDESVAVENSMMYSLALRKHHIPFELHVYPSGRHGLGMADEDSHVRGWTQACEMWIQIQVSRTRRCGEESVL